MTDRLGAMVTLAIMVGLLAFLSLVYMQLAVAQELGAGVSSRVCHLTGNPWLAAGRIERVADGCAWEANGWAWPDDPPAKVYPPFKGGTIAGG